MMLLYGCHAPWLQTNDNETCEIDLDIKTMDAAEMDKIFYFVIKLKVLDKFDTLPDCPKPCVTMDIKLKNLLSGTRSNRSFLVAWKSKQVYNSIRIKKLKI